MRVRDDEVFQALAPVAVVGQDVVEQLEDVDPMAWAAVDVHEHELAVRQADQGAVSLADIRKDRFELSHDRPSTSQLVSRLDSMTRTSRPTTVAGASDVTGPPQIGVCLSGGGFRAAFFGLGVLRYLAEAGRLADVVAVSAVSGGSITAAVLADRWPDLQRESFSDDAFERHVTAPVVAAVTEHNMRNRGLARWAVTRVAPRRRRIGATVGATIASHLLRTRKVAELPPGLQIVLTSTDLVSGRAFRVSRDFIGGWQFGYAPTPPGLSLGTTIAASTAVPFLFPPVPLRTRDLGLNDGTPPELALVDGGVYDNLGLEWFQGWDRGRPALAREVDFVLVVDASGPLTVNAKRYGWVTSLHRSQQAQYAQTRASRVRWFVDQLIAGTMHGLYIPIDRDPAAFVPPSHVTALPQVADGALPTGFASALGGLRTDLDRFLPEEATLLMYHAYWTAHVRLRHIRPELAVAAPRWRDMTDMSPAEAARLRGLLADGSRQRMFRR